MGKRIWVLAPAFFLLFPQISFSQVDTAWIRTYGGAFEHFAIDVEVDKNGNVYMTGNSSVGNQWDYVTIKYAPNGDAFWVRRYNGPANGNDQINDYPNPPHHVLAVDNDGNAYVTGTSDGIGTSKDIATIKYAPNGDTLWVRRYNGQSNSDDRANSIWLDANSNVYVIGNSIEVGTDRDYTIIKYSSAGDSLWVRTYNGFLNDRDYAYSSTVDINGNVYVTGNSSEFDPFVGYVTTCTTLKYSPNGDTLWISNYKDSSDFGETPVDMTTDQDGNVYIAANSYEPNSDTDPITIKIGPNGDTSWVRRYNGIGFTDKISSIAVDSGGNVYVAGTFFNAPNCCDIDYLTIKYSPSGDTVWVNRFNSAGLNYDAASSLTLDKIGNVYVTGYATGYAGNPSNTIKYAPNGNILWTIATSPPLKANYSPTDIEVDSLGNVYITGYVTQPTVDYSTVKYIQFQRGDLNQDGALTPADVVLELNCVFLGTGNCSLALADVNCDGNLSPADVVVELNAVFLAGPVCSL